MIEKPINKVGIDFDNTLVNTSYNTITGNYDMGTAIEAVCDAVNEQAWQGKKIIIWTARPKKEWPQVRAWLDNEGVIYHKIKKKPLVEYMVDDRSMRPDEFIIFNRVNK